MSWPQSPKIVLLAAQIWRNIVTEQEEETCNRKGFVAVPDDLKVYSVLVEIVGEEGNKGVYWDHEEDSNNAAGFSVLIHSLQMTLDLLPLLIWLQIMRRMAPN